MRSRGISTAGSRRAALPERPSLQIGVVGKRWPFVARTAGARRHRPARRLARLHPQATASGSSRATLACSDSTPEANPCSATPWLFDRLEAGWDLAEGDSGWTIRRLSIKSPLADLKAEGQITGTAGLARQRIEGRVDLAEVARQLPHALRLRDGLAVDRGSARLTIDVESVSDKATYDIEAKVSDLAARDHDRALTLRDPATVNAHVIRDGQASSLDRFEVKTSFLDASARGRLVDGVELKPPSTSTSSGASLPSGSTSVGSNCRPGVRSRGLTGPRTGSKYENLLKATFRDLNVNRFIDQFLPGNGETLTMKVDGPAEGSGWPTGWDHVDAWIGRDRTRARVKLESKDRDINVDAFLADFPFGMASDLNRRLSLVGDWSSSRQVFSIDSLRLDVGSKRDGKTIPAPARLPP